VPQTDRLADWVALIGELWPERDAAGWDAPGLQVGDPADPVGAVLVCLDVTPATLDEAAARGADLVLAHHPLLFRPLARLTPATASGLLALRAARAGIAVLAAHTNLDAAVPGTTDPIAAVLGLTDLTPLAPLDEPGEDPRPKGIGLVGTLPAPLPLRAAADALAAGLPAPALRVAGDLDAAVRRVAACGGAGDSLIAAAAAAGADLYVTGDLRHHAVLDARTLGMALIDAGHWATEAAALPAARARLEAAARERGLHARLLASEIVTDPWAAYAPGAGSRGRLGRT
jgi:dinuclear metal center YbgI/SA1388 family protein